MIKTFLAVAANRVIIDAMSNQLSIIDVFEGLKSQSFPIVIPNVTFLFYLQRDGDDPSSKDISLKCSVDGVETLKIPVRIDFQQGNTTRAIIGVQGFLIPNVGELKVALLDGEVELGGLELPVGQLDIPLPQVTTNQSPLAGA